MIRGNIPKRKLYTFIRILITILHGLLQDLRSYLVANKLKHIVSKGEKNQEDLSKREVTQLINTACNFLIARHGSNPNILHRKSLGGTIYALFPRLEVEKICKKLTQRVVNLKRVPTVMKSHESVEAFVSNRKIDEKVFQTVAVESKNEGKDFEDLLEVHKIALLDGAENESCTTNYDEEFLDDEDETIESFSIASNKTDDGDVLYKTE